MNDLNNKPSSFKQWIILEVTEHNKLLSQVAKEHGISAKKIYQWIKASQSSKCKQQDDIIGEIALLQQKLAHLNKQLSHLQQ
ncbi:transposase [Shewanella intestini]|uniref:Transposase n=1 Tax=Shewanella intestini TaxID=2017544 RepID=A0ABS5I2I7_9GAMM|nr:MULTISPECIES: transposase [Shewanella]MBR9727615.1 transposase [Shewanella intestini]